MHVILALTLIHETHLSPVPDRRRSSALAFHWYHGTALFNAKLSMAPPHEHGALWAAAALLGVTAFADIQARTPQEAWPLAPPSRMDLN